MNNADFEKQVIEIILNDKIEVKRKAEMIRILSKLLEVKK